MDGGNLDNSVDAGEIFTKTNSYDMNYFFDTSVAVLYQTGNLFTSTYATGYDANLRTETGIYHKFFKISRDYTNSSFVPVSNDVSLTGDLGFELLHSDNYKIYDKQRHIIYFLPSYSNLNYSGINPESEIVSNPVPVSFAPVYRTIYFPNYEIIPENNVFTPSGNMLLVYNASSQESIDIKNYYTGMRTGLQGVNILGINCSIGHSGELIDVTGYIKNIREPIHGWIYNSAKPIKYVCLLHGIPTRITGDVTPVRSASIGHDLGTSMCQYSGYARHPKYVTRTPDDYKQILYPTYPNYAWLPLFEANSSNAYNVNILKETLIRGVTVNTITGYRPFLFEEYSGQSFLCTHIASLERREADVSGYIRMICSKGKVSGAYLVGSGQNSGFFSYLDGPEGYAQYTTLSPQEHYLNLGINLKKSYIETGVYLFTGYNMCGFTSKGWHDATWASAPDPNIGGQWAAVATQFSGYNWYVTTNYESYAGKMLDEQTNIEMLPHSPISRQIKPTAMGGTDYSNIPVGFIGTMDEPSASNIASSQIFNAWFEGLPWIEAAYVGLRFNPSLIWGDPLLICK
jgi:hypothetical protein